jgi:hypothetical protein
MSSRDLNSRSFSTIETGLRDIQAIQNTSRVAGALLQDTVDLTKAEVDLTKAEVDLTKAEVALTRHNTASIAASIDNLMTETVSLTQLATQTSQTMIAAQQDLGGLRLDFKTSQRAFSADIDAKLLQEREHYREEMLTFRDDFLHMMTGHEANVSSHRLASAAHLSDSSKRHLGIQIQKQLLHCPNTLRQAADNSLRILRRGPESMLQCHCRPSRELISKRRGVLRFEYERYAQHDPRCPFHRSNVRAWSYTIAMKLLPFLNKTVSLTLGANFGAGAWAMAAPLRFYATVERAKSPLFGEFDKFVTTCVSEKRFPLLLPLKELKLDLLKTAYFLDAMIVRLSCSFQDGSAHGSDVDEYGCTMLHVSYYIDIKLGVFLIAVGGPTSDHNSWSSM